jgi:hypothetical protein
MGINVTWVVDNYSRVESQRKGKKVVVEKLKKKLLGKKSIPKYARQFFQKKLLDQIWS